MNNDLEQFSEEMKINPALLEFLRVASRMADLCRTYTILHDNGDYKERVINECKAVMETVERLLATTPQPAHTEQGGWIKCSERMPEEGGRYWCYVEEQNSLGKSHYQWNCSWNGDCWSDDALSGRVTHWMPLPAAPKPESE